MKQILIAAALLFAQPLFAAEEKVEATPVKDKLQSELINLIESSKEGIIKGVDFAKAQAPDLIQQILTWHFVVNLIQFCGAIGILIFFIWYCRKAINWIVAEDANGKDVSFPLFCSAVGALFQILPFIFMINFVWLKIWVAPKLFLVEYAARLIQ